MTRYSNEKNPYYCCIRCKDYRPNERIWCLADIKREGSICKRDKLFEEGFIAGEKDAEEAMAFSEEDKLVLEKLIVLSKPCLDDSERITLEALRKKVQG